jgi:SAM-dependent methyltransferase
MNVARAKYDGVVSILRYNWHYYAASLCILIGIGILVGVRQWSRTVELVLIGAACITAFWSFSSLLASYYIYDHIGVTRWNWIPPLMSPAPRRWLNIHAGLDDSTQKLAVLFPNAEHMVLDIYDPREMPEPSIARARRSHQPEKPIGNARLDDLPIPNQQCDAVFLLFAAHEIRQRKRREDFFLEVSRVLADSGELLLVEHMRDWKNFIAFGPGFLHFFSRREWLQAVQQAGLRITREDQLTPMVRYFFMKKLSP